MRTRLRVTWCLSALLAVGACTPSVEPSTSDAPSAAASSRSGPIGDLPHDCEPIDLRTPTGERVELNGAWTEIGSAGGNPMTWWIRSEGNCVWGAGTAEEVHPEGTFETRPDHVQSMSGHIGPDLVITGEIISLGALPIGAPRDPPRYAPLEMQIVFDDAGAITLREDREPGVTGPRCPDPVGYCPAPLVLRRAV